MTALTADLIVDRVTSIVTGAPFQLVEATTWTDFDRQPTTNVDGVFRIPPLTSQSAIGGFAYSEDRTDTLQVWIARKHQHDYATVRRRLLQDVHSLTAAIIRDAHQVSGDYGVLDEGRGHAIEDLPEAEYLTLRLTLPVNYDAEW
jgi:hypothetical protein